MSCFIDYIGLKQCGVSGVSGDYINDLAGISTEMVGKIANSEQGNYLGVWNSVQRRSINRLYEDLLSAMSDKVNMNRIVYQTKKLKKQYSNLVQENRGAYHRGVYLKVPEGDYVEFLLKGIFVYSKQAITTTVKVFDINDGSELYTKSTDLIVGLNYIEINESFPLRWEIMELFIGVDATNFDSVKTQPEYYYLYNNDWDCVSCDGGLTYNDNIFAIRPGELQIGHPAIWSNLRLFGIGQGVTIDGQIKCSISNYACQNKALLKTAFKYLLGAELLMEKNVSNQISFFTTSNLQITEALRLDYEKKYSDSLKKAVNTIPLEGNNLCFNCEDQATVYTSGQLP